jgi:hypothetical protein
MLFGKLKPSNQMEYSITEAKTSTYSKRELMPVPKIAEEHKSKTEAVKNNDPATTVETSLDLRRWLICSY